MIKITSLPENMQKMVIKAIYPSVTDEEKVLVALLKRGAVSEKTATVLPEEPALARLVDAEHVGKTAASRYYLTRDGGVTVRFLLDL